MLTEEFNPKIGHVGCFGKEFGNKTMIFFHKIYSTLKSRKLVKAWLSF